MEILDPRYAPSIINGQTPISCFSDPVLNVGTPPPNAPAPPVAFPDSFVVEAGVGLVVLRVLSNDRTPPDDPISISSISPCGGPFWGQASVAGGQSVLYKPMSGFVGTERFNYAIKDTEGLFGVAAVSIEVRNGWRNHALPADVNGDSHISPLDALLIFNELNVFGSHPFGAPPTASTFARMDVDGNGFVNPLDALIAINELNRIAAAQAEGEATGAPVASDASHVASLDALFQQLANTTPRTSRPLATCLRPAE